MLPPDNSHRIAVVGRTGSGKTQSAVYMLGRLRKTSWRDMPVTIFNSKNDKLINRLPAKEISLYKKPPTEPGLYMVRPAPDEDDEATQEYFKAVWANTHHGLFIDEVYELGPRNKAFRRLLTQGRALQIPMMYCMQRPVFCDPYALSEADYLSIFHLRIEDDHKKLKNMVPTYNREGLARYQSHWYDVGSDEGAILSPVPSADAIVAEYSDVPTGVNHEPRNGIETQRSYERRIALL